MVWRVIIGTAIGLLAGALLGTVLKARGGTCPLTCNPYGAAVIGAILGGMAGLTLGPAAPVAGMENVPAVASAEEFDRSITAADRPVFVDFYSNGCPPCRKLGPLVGKLAAEYGESCRFLKVDTGRLGELAVRHGVRGVPTVLVFADGQVVHRLVGLKSEREYRSVLDSIIKQYAITQERGAG